MILTCPLYNQDISVVISHISMAFKYLPYFFRKQCSKTKNVAVNNIKDWY